MAKQDSQIAIPDEVIMSKIYVIRDENVMIERDLAELYGVETEILKGGEKKYDHGSRKILCSSLPSRNSKNGGAKLAPPMRIEWYFVCLHTHSQKHGVAQFSVY